MVAEKIALPCKHEHCGKLTTPELALVQKCYKEFPKPSIDNPQEENPPYFLSDRYESIGCCDVANQERQAGVLKSYGENAAHDILRFERNLASMFELSQRVLELRTLWQKAFLHEMKLLLGIFQPQALAKHEETKE